VRYRVACCLACQLLVICPGASAGVLTGLHVWLGASGKDKAETGAEGAEGAEGAAGEQEGQQEEQAAAGEGIVKEEQQAAAATTEAAAPAAAEGAAAATAAAEPVAAAPAATAAAADQAVKAEPKAEAAAAAGGEDAAAQLLQDAYKQEGEGPAALLLTAVQAAQIVCSRQLHNCCRQAACQADAGSSARCILCPA
jgi:hypothetical protein